MACGIDMSIKVRGNPVVSAHEDLVFGVYIPYSLGMKGEIWGKMANQDPTFEERKELFEHGIQTMYFQNAWYKTLECVPEYADIFRRVQWYATNRASAYADSGIFNPGV